MVCFNKVTFLFNKFVDLFANLLAIKIYYNAGHHCVRNIIKNNFPWNKSWTLTPALCQAFIWTNAGLLPIGLLTTHISSYWNKKDLNQFLPQNNKGLKGHLQRFEFVFSLV